MPLPDQVGQYRLLAPIGSGGMGTVWEAHDETLDRRVAIKVIRPDRAADPKTVRRFKREARLAASLDHPFICKVLDFQESGGDLLIVMEYVEGRTLESVLDHGPLSVDYTIRIARELAEALSLAHEKGLVHRDIKPSNVMITAHGHVKAMDFGLAKLLREVDADASTSLTGDETLIGTPSYMSPEQARGLPASPGSDVFSFGVLLYRCLSGRLPFEGDNRADYLANLVSDAPRPLPDSVPEKLAALVDRCLEKSPPERWSSFDEILMELQELMSRRDAEGRRAEIVSSGRPLLRTGILVAGIASIALILFFLLRPQEAPLTARHSQQSLVTWASHERDPDISPDDRLLVFRSDRGDRNSIWVMDLGTGEAREVAGTSSSDLLVKTPVWSPDGETIAYLREEDEGDGSFVEFIFPWGGRAEDPFFFETSAGIGIVQVNLVRWTDAGLYVDIDGSLWSFDLGERRLTRFASDLAYDEVDVRSGGGEIVFSLFDQGQTDLWISDSTGGDPRQLTDTPFSETNPRWRSSAGQEVLYLSDEGGQVDIWVLHVDDQSRRRLTSSPLREAEFATSTTGTLLVHGDFTEESDLWTLSPGEDRPSLLTDDSRRDFWPSVAGDSRLLAFHRSQPRLRVAPTPPALLAQIYITTLDSPEEARMVVEEGFGARLSPDGRWIAFLSFPTDHGRLPELAAQDRISRRRIRLAEHFHVSRFLPGPLDWLWSNLTWDPNEEATVYYIAALVPGGAQVQRATLGAGEHPRPEVLATAEDPEVRFADLRLSTDSSTLGFVSGTESRRSWRVRALDLATGVTEPVYSATDSESLYLKGWADDTTLIVLREAVAGGPVEVLGVTDGVVRRIGVLEEVSVGGAVLDRAGRRLIVNSTQHGHSRVMAFSLEDGSSSTLVEDREPNVAFAGFNLAPDGTLVYARAQANRDLWTMRLEQ